ncbi:sterol desaturase/sphingolipid hydroxylase (fatty acid hydroxylase superfamily) [Elusimicrobium simillimum]|uniref:DUF2798 domain-containing protein n=1 Tax=Elusimicrobium simillimum TaxID=3143438 RepID=UPI003C7035C7
MPQNKFEGLVFALIMVFVMVYCMTLYNAILKNGFDYFIFIKAALTMWPEAAGAFFIQRYFGGPLALMLLPRVIDVKKEKKAFIAAAMGLCTVLIMAPTMTLYVSVMHHGVSWQLPMQWLECLARNFAFALCLQIFCAGPLVRFSFSRIFRRQTA